MKSATVEANATLQADIILAHRTDIQAARALVVSMLGELEAAGHACQCRYGLT